ncbi:RimK family alpha-L-glutamate ligase [Nocardioides sp. R-C-SC26]|uniref:ATP-grasp domain-containing protein n=1 Tax=Nocardioides sp. R-C-SC26 TaxID=2870414 RepID=UPI001E4CB27A|nr:hypothetical protein [Nocardioides sp. R-C-SC26]
MTSPAVLLLATSAEYVDGEPGHAALDEALRERGIEARWVRWDDPGVDWEAGLVAVRSTWDYQLRLDEFLAWARSVPRLLNGSEVFSWNTDKRYLLELAAAGLAVVPTLSADTEGDVRAALTGRTAASVVKPRVGAGGDGLVVVEPGATWTPPAAGPTVGWVVQPVVESVRTDGERSLFVLRMSDGPRVVGTVHKRPGAGGDVRVNEEHGGHVVPAALDDIPALPSLALEAWAATEAIVGRALDYARVDVLRHDGAWVVGEVEVTEPGLYLDVAPHHAVPFAEFALTRLQVKTGQPSNAR